MKKLLLWISFLFVQNIIAQIVGFTGSYSLQNPEKIFFPDRVIKRDLDFYGRYSKRENGKYDFSDYHYDFTLYRQFSTEFSVNTLSKFIINNFEFGYSVLITEFVNSFSVYPNLAGFSAKQRNNFEINNLELKLGRSFFYGSKYNRFIFYNSFNFVSIYNVTNSVNVKLGEPGFDNGNGNATFQEEYLSRITKFNFGLELSTEFCYAINDYFFIGTGYIFRIIHKPFSSSNPDAVRQTNDLNRNLNFGNIVDIKDGLFFNHFISISIKYIPQSINSQKFKRRLNRL